MLSFRSFTRFLMIILIPIALSCKGKSSGDHAEAESSQPGSVSGTGSGLSPQEIETTSETQETGESNQPGTSTANPAGELAMQDASLNGDAATVRQLVGEGIDVNATDQDNRTARMYASFNGHTEIVQFLIDSGAEVALRDAAGRNALLYASTGPFPETVRLLLENNADPNIREATESFTPIMHAAAEGQLEVVKILLEYGADPALKDVDGESAYMFAVANGHMAVAAILE